MTDEARRWFAGVDRGSERHQACLLDAAGTVVGERAFAHGGAGLAALCDWLVSVAGHPGAGAAGLRTDPPLSRPVGGGTPAVIELREWSRLAEELQRERLRLANRIRQQLWRYYPQLLALSDDLTAEWMLELWSLAPTPAEAVRLSEATLAPLLRRHRIRRLDAAGV